MCEESWLTTKNLIFTAPFFKAAYPGVRQLIVFYFVCFLLSCSCVLMYGYSKLSPLSQSLFS